MIQENQPNVYREDEKSNGGENVRKWKNYPVRGGEGRKPQACHNHVCVTGRAVD